MTKNVYFLPKTGPLDPGPTSGDAVGKTGSIRAAARQARISRNAVRRELKQLVTPLAPKSIPRKSKLDPYTS
jgi:hypothetical protein